MIQWDLESGSLSSNPHPAAYLAHVDIMIKIDSRIQIDSGARKTPSLMTVNNRALTT